MPRSAAAQIPGALMGKEASHDSLRNVGALNRSTHR